VRSLLDHAIEATPRRGVVKLGIAESANDIALVVEDGGPVVPMSNVTALLDGRLDPSSVGRPTGIALLVAMTAAGRLGAILSFGESEGGAAQMTVRLPKA
jgi:sensor histidine kinase regulating citrate/malate metabolism